MPAPGRFRMAYDEPDEEDEHEDDELDGDEDDEDGEEEEPETWQVEACSPRTWCRGGAAVA